MNGIVLHIFTGVDDRNGIAHFGAPLNAGRGHNELIEFDSARFHDEIERDGTTCRNIDALLLFGVPDPKHADLDGTGWNAAQAVAPIRAGERDECGAKDYDSGFGNGGIGRGGNPSR